MLDRSFWRWVCIVAALVLAVLWMASVAVSGFSAPSWVPPGAVLALAMAAALFAPPPPASP